MLTEKIANRLCQVIFMSDCSKHNRIDWVGDESKTVCRIYHSEFLVPNFLQRILKRTGMAFWSSKKGPERRSSPPNTL